MPRKRNTLGKCNEKRNVDNEPVPVVFHFQHFIPANPVFGQLPEFRLLTFKANEIRNSTTLPTSYQVPNLATGAKQTYRFTE